MDDSERNPDWDNQSEEKGSSSKFVTPGILLFLDQLLVAAGSWIYWLVLSKFTTASEIGEATAIYAFAVTIATLTQLGFEYPLLKRSYSQRFQVLGTVLLLELGITLASLPIAAYFVAAMYPDTPTNLIWIVIGMLVLSAVGFAPRFAILGLSNARSILIIESIGTVLKFVAGYLFIVNGLGAVGILLSFLVQSVLVNISTLIVARRHFSFRWGSVKYAKELVKESLFNTPAKLSKMFILTLSVSMLSIAGAVSADIGIFYMALMISTIAGGLVSNISYMVLPASSLLNRDLSSSSIRIGLGLISPIIAVLLVAPKSVLSIIGPEYTTGENVLAILSLSILPYCLSTNIISKLNNLGKSREMMLIGMAQLVAFLISFGLLVPNYNIMGAAISISISFIVSSVLSIAWIDNTTKKYIILSMAAISIGWTIGYVIGIFMQSSILPAFASIIVSAIFVLFFRITTYSELNAIVKTVSKRGR